MNIKNSENTNKNTKWQKRYTQILKHLEDNSIQHKHSLEVIERLCQLVPQLKLTISKQKAKLAEYKDEIKTLKKKITIITKGETDNGQSPQIGLLQSAEDLLQTGCNCLQQQHQNVLRQQRFALIQHEEKARKTSKIFNKVLNVLEGEAGREEIENIKKEIQKTVGNKKSNPASNTDAIYGVFNEKHELEDEKDDDNEEEEEEEEDDDDENGEFVTKTTYNKEIEAHLRTKNLYLLSENTYTDLRKLLEKKLDLTKLSDFTYDMQIEKSIEVTYIDEDERQEFCENIGGRLESLKLELKESRETTVSCQQRLKKLKSIEGLIESRTKQLEKTTKDLELQREEMVMVKSALSKKKVELHKEKRLNENIKMNKTFHLEKEFHLSHGWPSHLCYH